MYAFSTSYKARLGACKPLYRNGFCDIASCLHATKHESQWWFELCLHVERLTKNVQAANQYNSLENNNGLTGVFLRNLTFMPLHAVLLHALT